ncbi:hypothetical protein [Qipengyuania sp. 483]
MNTDLNRLSAELDQAKADFALLQRLQGAKERMETLANQCAEAREAESNRNAIAAREERETRYARISEISITEAPSNSGNGLLHRLFRISWKAPQFDWRTNRSDPAKHSVVGFQAVPHDVLACIIEKHPELIPADIMALRPGDADGAIQEFFAAKNRVTLVDR